MTSAGRIRHSRSFLSLSISLAVLLAGCAFVAPSRVSAETRVELYTVGAGDVLFTKFGHAAICLVEDDASFEDGICYNYGTTDFSRPVGLGWDVLRGRALFWVSVATRSEMLYSFEWSDRTVYVQPLPLTHEQVSVLSNALAIDTSEENREYVYNHFLENCSTRPRDLIDEATGGRLRRAQLAEAASYRDFARRGFVHDRALFLAADFILGRWADRSVSAFEAMFLPEVLRESVRNELGVEPRIVYRRQAPLPTLAVSRIRRDALGGASVVFLIAFLAALRGSATWQTWVHRTAGLVMGSLGLVLAGLAFTSALPELRVNESLMVFLPFDFLLLRRSPFSFRYALLRSAVLLLVWILGLVGAFLQPIGPYWTLAFGLMLSSAIALAPARERVGRAF